MVRKDRRGSGKQGFPKDSQRRSKFADRSAANGSSVPIEAKARSLRGDELLSCVLGPAHDTSSKAAHRMRGWCSEEEKKRRREERGKRKDEFERPGRREGGREVGRQREGGRQGS